MVRTADLETQLEVWRVRSVKQGYADAYACARADGLTILLRMVGAPIVISDVQDIRSVLRAMVDEDENLKFRIQLESVSLSEAAVQLLGQVSQGIEVLSLMHMELPTERLKSLLVKLKRVKTLNLSYNKWKGTGLGALCEWLRSSTDITRLLLVGLNIDDAGICELANAIGTLKHMRMLDVTSNDITDKGAVYATWELRWVLKSLRMGNNRIMMPDVLGRQMKLDNLYLRPQRCSMEVPKMYAFIGMTKRTMTLSFPKELLRCIFKHVRDLLKLELNALYSSSQTQRLVHHA